MSTEIKEISKLAWRLLDDIYRAIEEDNSDKVMEMGERIMEVNSALYTVLGHDTSPVPKAEHNPERYSALSKPMKQEDADDALNAFFGEVSAARQRHKIQDVHVIVRMMIDRETGDAPGMSSIHLGAVQESEAMCAWAFALAGEKRRAFIDNAKAEGIRGARS